MAEFKDQLKLATKESGGRKLSNLNYTKWFKEASRNTRNLEVERVKGKYFEGGKMYFFRYVSATKRLKWYDKRPLIISLGQRTFTGSVVEQGINLNLLPYTVKINLLDWIYNSYEDHINTEITKNNSSKATLQRSFNLNINDISSIVSTDHVDFAIRNYSVGDMDNKYVISYENWTKMILIEDYDFDNINMRKIYTDYRKFSQNKRI